MSILKVEITMVPLFFLILTRWYLRLSKILFGQKFKKEAKVFCLIKNHFQLLDATSDWGPAKISPFGIKVKMQAKK